MCLNGRTATVAHATDFISEKPRRAAGVKPAIPGIQIVCVSPPRHRGLGWGSTGEQ